MKEVKEILEIVISYMSFWLIFMIAPEGFGNMIIIVINTVGIIFSDQ